MFSFRYAPDFPGYSKCLKLCLFSNISLISTFRSSIALFTVTLQKLIRIRPRLALTWVRFLNVNLSKYAGWKSVLSHWQSDIHRGRFSERIYIFIDTPSFMHSCNHQTANCTTLDKYLIYYVYLLGSYNDCSLEVLIVLELCKQYLCL